VTIPPKSKKSDWEVELGVIIGTKAKNIKKADALKHVAGYCGHQRPLRARLPDRAGRAVDQGQILRHLRPRRSVAGDADEIKDPQKLGMWLELNGKRVQNGSTATMVFGVPTSSPISRSSSPLMPGDIITTGTPEGARRRHGHEAAALPQARLAKLPPPPPVFDHADEHREGAVGLPGMCLFQNVLAHGEPQLYLLY
jgi:2-keto-4-pentenoate hydratase/2-oxohepta-3-ene-1,7-dioic acid hydratase in catechol pathway